MNTVALSTTDPAASVAQTVGTLANALSVGSQAISNMIGVDLVSVPDVDLESYLATVIMNELEAQGDRS